MRPVTITLPAHSSSNFAATRRRCSRRLVSLAEKAPGALYYSRTDLAVIAAAMLEGSAVCVRYEHDDEITARVLFPSAIFLTKANHICVRALLHLSPRDEVLPRRPHGLRPFR